MVLEGTRNSKEISEFDAAPSTPFSTNGISNAKERAIVNQISSNGLDDIESEAQRLVVCTLRAMNLTDSTRHMAEAMILHAGVLRSVPLSSRRLHTISTSEAARSFVADFATQASSLLECSEWSQTLAKGARRCDTADCVDGRIFAWCTNLILDQPLAREALEDLRLENGSLIAAVGIKANLDASRTPVLAQAAEKRTQKAEGHGFYSSSLLPFTNPVFDTHMASIRISVDENACTEDNPKTAKIFKELSHWHVTKPLQRKKQSSLIDNRRKQKALKRNQYRMKDMIAYSASLTNATGKILEPETIVVNKDSAGSAAVSKNAKAAKPDKSASNPQAPAKKAPSSVKTAQKGSKKAEMLEGIAARNAQKEVVAEEKVFNSWRFQLDDMRYIQSDRVRYEKVEAYLKGLSSEKRKVIGSEVELYLLNILLKMWSKVHRAATKDEHLSSNISSLMWNHINCLGNGEQPLTQTVFSCLQSSCKSLGFPEPSSTAEKLLDRKLSFPFLLKTADTSLRVTKDPVEFQLANCGPYFDRSIDSAPDERVRFNPDGWQRRVLDLVDANKSIFVVAPTSAGKTFISFYSMKKVLSSSDDGILVYVAPTKALVNQIAAEIQANFRKSYSQEAKSVWAIHTRDNRVRHLLLQEPRIY